ncbi:hypothetical protein ACFUJU_16975 [Streptomyces sp. NPDC057235]|uniref:hypothetical protein n=1 Tax=Streptomyces sp. NPDC057235 TaxID=3346058 RepID=UPI0036384C43
MADTAVTRQIDPPYQVVPATSPHAVLVLPRELGEDGSAWYHDTALDLVKALKHEGVDASFAHTADERRWLGEKSQLQYALDAVVGIIAAGAYDGIKLLLRGRHRSVPVRLRVTRQSSEGVWEWYEIEGDGEGVAEALGQLSPGVQNPELPESEV